MTNECSVPTPTSMNLLLYIAMAYEALTAIPSASMIGMHAKVIVRLLSLTEPIAIL